MSRRSDENVLTTQPGTYALLLRLDRAVRLTIGARGEFDLPRGWYIYFMSAARAAPADCGHG